MRRTLFRASTSRLGLFGLAQSQELTEHTSTHRALIQILSGECGFSRAGQQNLLKTGGLLNLPPNLPHDVKAATQFSVRLTLSKPEKD